MSDQPALGKKVIFLYPPPVLSEVAEELAKSEFEVYLAHDHLRLRKLLAGSGDSILFINIDKVPEPGLWEPYIRDILHDEAFRHVGVGVMTMNDPDPGMREKYILGLQVPCGYVGLKLATAHTIDILKKILDANEARGKRKYVRASCPPGTGQCNVDMDGSVTWGDILDISSAGMAVSFHGGQTLKVGTVLGKLSILVKGVRLLVDGFVAAHRKAEDGLMISIVMFIPNSLDEERTNKLRILVYRLNQQSLDQRLLAMN